MSPKSILDQLLLHAARAAYDDRFPFALSDTEQRVREEVQDAFQQVGSSVERTASALALIERRERAGAIDCAFAAILRCTLLLDPDAQQGAGAEEQITASCKRAVHATRAAAQGSYEQDRARALRAAAARLQGSLQRRRGNPAQALRFDRVALHLTDSPRDFANVLSDHLQCGDQDRAQQLYFESRLTRPRDYARELETLVHDDIDLAPLTLPSGDRGGDLPGLDYGGEPPEIQHQLRQHICQREQPKSRAFWLNLVDLLLSEAERNPSLQPSPTEEWVGIDDAIVYVLSEVITRSWRVFQGSCEADLHAYLRGMLLHRELDAPRRRRMAADPRH